MLLFIFLGTLKKGNCWVSSGPDEGDVSDGEEADEEGAADHARVPGVGPVHQRRHLGQVHHVDRNGHGHVFAWASSA